MKAVSSILALALSVLLFSGCSKNDDEAVPSRWVNNTEELQKVNQDKVSITQGISGTITLVEGNCMPLIGPDSSCKEYPVKRSIKVYPYTKIQALERHDDVYYTINAKPVLIVASDAEGFYQAELKPGTYSVFIQENGKLYANGGDGQGGVNPVEVKEDTVITLNLRLDYAVY